MTTVLLVAAYAVATVSSISRGTRDSSFILFSPYIRQRCVNCSFSKFVSKLKAFISALTGYNHISPDSTRFKWPTTSPGTCRRLLKTCHNRAKDLKTTWRHGYRYVLYCIAVCMFRAVFTVVFTIINNFVPGTSTVP